jgi:hypothetical protein
MHLVPVDVSTGVRTFLFINRQPIMPMKLINPHVDSSPARSNSAHNVM